MRATPLATKSDGKIISQNMIAPNTACNRIRRFIPRTVMIRSVRYDICLNRIVVLRTKIEAS